MAKTPENWPGHRTFVITETMPQAAVFTQAGAQLRAEPLTDAILPQRVVYLHGWEHTRESLRPLANALIDVGESWLVDLPGFGETPPPPEGFTPQQYAGVLAGWLNTLPPLPTVLVGNGFGFHVALHVAGIAQQTPHKTLQIKALVSLAGTGLPQTAPQPGAAPRRNLWQKLFGAKPKPSPQPTYYLAAGEAMRATHQAMLHDDTGALCATVPQPTLLIYAAEDTRVPLATGKRFHKLLPGSTLQVLEKQGHTALLQTARHTVAQSIRTFLQPL